MLWDVSVVILLGIAVYAAYEVLLRLISLPIHRNRHPSMDEATRAERFMVRRVLVGAAVLLAVSVAVLATVLP